MAWTKACDEAGDYVVPNVLCPRDLVPDLTIWTKLYYHNHELFLFLVERR